MVTYRATTGISWPKDEAAAKRILAGEARPDDWTDAAAGEACAPPEPYRRELLAAGRIRKLKAGEEVKGDG